jgi:predicted metal-binding membrane protein
MLPYILRSNEEDLNAFDLGLILIIYELVCSAALVISLERTAGMALLILLLIRVFSLIQTVKFFRNISRVFWTLIIVNLMAWLGLGIGGLSNLGLIIR